MPRLSQLFLLENSKGKDAEAIAIEAISASFASLVSQQGSGLDSLTGLFNMQAGVWKVPQVAEVLKGKVEEVSAGTECR